MNNQCHDDNLIWIDLEMTGLNPDRDRILEIATLITDKHLHVLAEGPVLAIHQSEAILSAMDPWNIKHHTASGLLDRVKQTALTEAQAEHATLQFLQSWVPAAKSPMCGNTICQDRRFLFRHMPQLEKYFHYRHLDVSTVKELARLWAPKLRQGMTKQSKHLALEDIKESIAELQYYRDCFFVLEV